MVGWGGVGLGWGGACPHSCEIARAVDVRLQVDVTLQVWGGVGLGWGGACSHSCEVAHAVDVTLQVRGGVGAKRG